MPYSGSGTFDVYTPGNPRVSGTVIASAAINNTNTDFASGLTNAVTRDGQSPATANLPMGGFKHTGVAIAAALTDYARASQVQDGSITWLTALAGTNTITATGPISMAAYTTGMVLRFIPANSTTGAVTININAIGAVAILKTGNQALETGDMVSNQVQTIVYDGTQFQLISPLRLKVGSYTGDGALSLNVTGIGFTPKVVVVLEAVADGVASIFGMTTSTMIARDAQGLGLFMSTGAVTNLDNRFISLQLGSFTVGDDGVDGFPNTTGQAYDYIAWG